MLRNITGCESLRLALQAGYLGAIDCSCVWCAAIRVHFRLEEGALKEITALFLAAG